MMKFEIQWVSIAFKPEIFARFFFATVDVAKIPQLTVIVKKRSPPPTIDRQVVDWHRLFVTELLANCRPTG